MKRIEDIRPVKVRKEYKIELPIDQEMISSGFRFEAPVLPIEELQMSELEPTTKKISGRIIGQIIFALLIFAAVSLFCFISVIEAKNQISKEFLALNSNFSSFSDNISSKNIAALAIGIEKMNNSTSKAVLTLQSVGQDIYIFNLIYPKKKSSKSTMSVDAIRSAHLLTQSYERIAAGGSNQSSSRGSDYLSKINKYLSNMSNYLNSLSPRLRFALVSVGAAKSITDSIDEKKFSGSELQAVENLTKMANSSNDFFAYFTKTSDSLSSALALSGEGKSYLILFLNNSELRPGGGFIGSFARLDIANGKATKLDFEKNIYTLDKSYISAGNKNTPPTEYQGVTTNMTMRDSNYFADFADSSKNVLDFYQKESGRSADGLIAIDTTFFRELLKVTGPIEMPEYNLTVSDQNFMTDVQYQVEIGYFQDDANKKENQPKKILADLMPKMISALTSESKSNEKLASVITKAVSEKHLLMFHNSGEIEDLLNGIGASGKIADFDADYLYINDANIGGKKSSLNIAKTVDQKVIIDADGGISETLTIERKHNGSYEWPDGENVNFTKIFLPLATEVLDKSLKIAVENNKTAVSFWQNTKPGETSQSKFDYRRDFTVSLASQTFDWQIAVQKQPGIESFVWNLNLSYPKGWKPQNVDGYDAENHQIHLSETIFKDSVFQLRFIRD